MPATELQPLATGSLAAPSGLLSGSTRKVAGLVVMGFALWFALSVPTMEYTLLNVGMIAVALAGVLLRLIHSTRALGAGLMWGGLVSLAIELVSFYSWSALNLLFFLLGV